MAYTITITEHPPPGLLGGQIPRLEPPPMYEFHSDFTNFKCQCNLWDETSLGISQIEYDRLIYQSVRIIQVPLKIAWPLYWLSYCEEPRPTKDCRTTVFLYFLYTYFYYITICSIICYTIKSCEDGQLEDTINETL